MVRWDLVVIAFIVVVAVYALSIALPRFFLGFQVPQLLYVIIIITAILIALSGFLPYKWGNFLRYLAYFFLFISILWLELELMGVALKRYPTQEITLKNCTTLFGEKDKPDSVIDAVGIWSCVTTGYFPSKEGEFGWSIFTIFYIILPFAFVWTFIYGVMNGVGFKNLFGENFGKTATTLLSFIISMYAARQLFGFFLLDMFGYGAWGLVGLFGAGFFTLVIKKIIEEKFGTEKMGENILESLTSGLEKEREGFKILVRELRKIADYPPEVKAAYFGKMNVQGSYLYEGYSMLTSTTRSVIDTEINGTTTDNVNEKIENFLSKYGKFG